MYFNFGIATEAVNDFLNSKPANEYNAMKKFLAEDVTAAMEAIDRTGRRMNDYQSRYAMWIVRKIEEKCDKVDFGTIPNTRGDITKWDNYRKPLVGLINQINRISTTADQSDAIACMNDLHKFLVSQRADFEYGYKTENNFIILTYQVLCLSLVDIVAIATVESAKLSVDNAAGRMLTKPIKYTRDSRLLIKSIRSVLNVWKSGDWGRMIKHYKNSRIDMYKTTKTANEAAALESAFVGTISTVVLVAALSITGVIALVSAIRGLITIYYKTAVTIDDKARSMIAYLDEIAPYENNPDALAKQQKASDKLDKIAGFIEAKIIKDETRAEAEIAQEDRAATPQEMDMSMSDPNGFEFY